jgi:fatty acid desaturase
MQERIVHVQHHAETTLLSNPCKYVGAFRPIVDV